MRITSAPTVIQREAVSPYLDVALAVQGQDALAVTRDVEAAMKDFPFALEYHAEVLSGYVAQQAADQRMLLVGAVVVVGILLLMQAAYRSWRLAFAAVLTLPMALAGGVLALALSGAAFSLRSLLGLLAVLGIAIRNGIVMVRHFQHLEERDGETFGPELVLRGARDRLTPILATTFAVMLALVPFVLAGNTAGVPCGWVPGAE